MKINIVPFVKAGRQLWRRPLHFEPDWRLPLAVGAVVGGLLVFVVLFLEPWGTDRYQTSWRSLRLSGYGVCILVSFLIVHALDRHRWHRAFGVQPRWRLADEVFSKGLTVAALAVLTYAYNVWVVNQISASWSGFGDWLVFIVAPSLVVISVPAVWVRRRVSRRLAERRQRRGTIIVRGRNRDECLRLKPADFICAEAQQNYVDVHLIAGDRTEQRMLRTTLVDIERQIPAAVRVHRSWLVNPDRIEQVLGNARGQRLRIESFEREIPVSARFDLRGLSPLR